VREREIMSGFCCFRRGKVDANDERENTSRLKATATEKSKVRGDDAPTVAKGVSTTKPGGAAQQHQQSPVLLELFTSQGSSSCPPADVKFARLGQGQAKDIAGDVPVITLAYHVDYWNHLGWQDPFAKSMWTLRQRSYGQSLEQDSIYTPELVVQGRAHCVATDSDSATSLIQSAQRVPAPLIHVTFESTEPSTLQVSVTVSTKKKTTDETVDVMVALYENGLVTECTAGENRGKLLTNEYVVRGLETACTLQEGVPKKPVSGQVLFELWPGFSTSTTGIVVFLQNPTSKEIYGAEHFQLPVTL
jgi:hypothetical protein